jgi:hypothetical protein
MLRLLAEGHLAGVVLGDARARISETWGEPTDWSAKARERAKIWCYGEIEVYFDPADTVWLIHSDRGAMSMWEGSGDARVDPWVITPTLFTAALIRRSILLTLPVEIRRPSTSKSRLTVARRPRWYTPVSIATTAIARGPNACFGMTSSS